MTASGTNSYIIGERSFAVIDPGPDLASHRQALLRATDGAISAIIVTHTHLDHSAGAAKLKAETGAPLVAFGGHGAGMSAVMRALAAENLGGGEGADETFTPDQTLAHGETVEGPQWRLTALHTPGHISNHLCLALSAPEGDIVFTGDHVMGWASSLISPPDGDMGDFMRSLEVLLARSGDRMFLPGHGEPIHAPTHRLIELREHRRGREAAIRAELANAPQSPGELVQRLYRDVDPRLHGMAARNVLAHLIDLWEHEQARPSEEFHANARFRLLSRS